MARGWIGLQGANQFFTGLLDLGAKINLIKQAFVTQWELPALSAALPRPGFLDGKAQYCYGAHELTYHLVDSWGQHRQVTTLFYAVDFEGPDVIFGMPMLADESIIVDPAEATWRFKINAKNLAIEEPKDFAKNLNGEKAVFALVCAGVGEVTATNDSVVPTVPEQVKEYSEQFDDKKAGLLPEQKGSHHAIDLMEGQEPPFMALYNLSQKELAELRRYLEDALAKGWIKHSVSPAGAPILFVPKKDGGLRLCVDYRGLNAVTIKNRHPLPLITETLDRLSGAKRFTKLDLKDAYHRIRIKAGDEWKTAFRTRYGHFEYQVMPFGLANAPATFQAYINKALRGYIDVICVVYLDDILIYSSEVSDHWRHVRQVLQRLKEFQLYVNLKKCAFATTEVEFLGFVVSTEGVRMDEERIRTIKEWPKPKTYRELQVFLGFVNFYRRFIYQYSRIAGPLTGLLKGSKGGKKSGPFEWPESAELSYRHLRDIFMSAPLLIHYDPKKKIRMETDASNFALAGIISQQDDDGNWRPVAFMSRKMIPAEQNYETHDQELLAIVQAFKTWRHYLEGSTETIEVWSDHNNLRGFMKQKELNSRQARWALALAAFDFEIFHRPGKTNPADGPSRRPDYEGTSPDKTTLLPTLQNKLALSNTGDLSPPVSQSRREGSDDLNSRLTPVLTPDAVGAVSGGTPSQSIREQLQISLAPMFQLAGVSVVIPRRDVRALPEEAYGEPMRSMKSLIQELQAADTWAKEFRAKESAMPHRRRTSKAWSVDPEGLVRHNGRLYVPGDEAVRKELISKNHDDPLAGHFGPDKTSDLLLRKYYWAGCGKQVGEYVKTCDICQRTKAPRHKPYGELSSLPVSKNPWKEITMDFVTGLPPSKRGGVVYDSIFVVVDRCTKMARYIPTTVKCGAAELAETFFTEIVLKFGMPNGIVSDRGPVFTSAFWSSVCYHSKIKRRLSTAFHPQTDGLTERQNQVLEHYLRTFADGEQSQWANHLPLAEFAYNNSRHSSTGESPFYLMYGYHPEIHYEVEDNSAVEGVPEAKERVRRLNEIRNFCAQRLEHAAAQQAKYYNQKHKPMSYSVGDLVMLSTKNLKQKRPSKKLSHKFVGPFRVEDKVGSQAYRLTLPNTYRIHNTFHVSLLERYHHRTGDAEAESMLQAPELIDDDEQWEIEEIVDRVGGRKGVRYKVKWLGWGPEYNQWLPEEEFERASSLVREFENARSVKRRKR